MVGVRLSSSELDKLVVAHDELAWSILRRPGRQCIEEVFSIGYRCLENGSIEGWTDDVLEIRFKELIRWQRIRGMQIMQNILATGGMPHDNNLPWLRELGGLVVAHEIHTLCNLHDVPV